MWHQVHRFDFQISLVLILERETSLNLLKFEHSNKINVRQPGGITFTAHCEKCKEWNDTLIQGPHCKLYSVIYLLKNKTITLALSALDKINPLMPSLLLQQQRRLESEKQKPRCRCRFSRWDYGVRPQKKVPLRQSCSLQ